MRSIDLYKIQLSDLELFLAAARYGSFTRAGEKLFITQSGVSKRISQIESELGLILFLRSKREVTLTPAGRVLAQRLDNVVDAVLDAVQAAYAAQTGASGYLRIGYLEWGNVVFLDTMRRFIREHPQFSVELYRRKFSELRGDISADRVDVIFTASYDCDQFSGSGYNFLSVKSVPLMAYMSREHPLARQEELSMEELRGEPMLMVDEKSSTGYGTYVRELFTRHKIQPLIAQYAHDGGEHIGSLLINKGVLLASQCFLEDTQEKEIARVPVKGEEIFLTAVWKRGNANPVLEQFLKEIRRDMTV